MCKRMCLCLCEEIRKRKERGKGVSVAIGRSDQFQAGISKGDLDERC